MSEEFGETYDHTQHPALAVDGENLAVVENGRRVTEWMGYSHPSDTRIAYLEVVTPLCTGDIDRSDLLDLLDEV